MRKFLIVLIITTLSSSCKKQTNNDLLVNVKKQVILNEKIFIGEILVSNNDFVEKINQTCKIDDSEEINSEFGKNCILTTTPFENNFNSFKKIFSDFKFHDEIFNDYNDNRLSLKKVKVKDKYNNTFTEERTSFQVFLTTYSENKKVDSIAVFEHIDHVDFSYYIIKNYYIDKNKNIWILELNVGEEKIDILNWSKYNINNNGKIVLEKNFIAIKNEKKLSVRNEFEIWKGTYLFETYDRDNYLNSYQITINNHDDISVKWKLDKSSKNYLGKGKINNDKIEITFNGDEILYIEKSFNDFYISGEPVATINPGNDNFPIQKIK